MPESLAVLEFVKRVLELVAALAQQNEVARRLLAQAVVGHVVDVVPRLAACPAAATIALDDL
jgi:hypothetical protein